MPICEKQTKKHVPYLTVQNIAHTEKTTRAQHLQSCFAAADLKSAPQPPLPPLTPGPQGA